MRNLIHKILITEGRVEDMKKRYPEHENVVDLFVEGDPSGNNKYLQWMMKQHVKNQEDIGDILTVTTRFHQNIQRLQKKDINQYKTVNELAEALIKIGKSKGEKERRIKREGAKVVFENDNVIALRPLNHKASCKYGAGTKWCVTMRDTDEYLKGYTKKTSTFGGTDWYESEWVEEKIEPNFIQRLLGKKPEVRKKEVKRFIEEFPVGILYFVIFKRRVNDLEWDVSMQAGIPTYEPADPRDPMNKLALLYRPGRADFGDLDWSRHLRGDNFLGMIGDKLDAAHNNLSIFNALDKKVTLRQVGRELDQEFSVPFRFIEHDFQEERVKIMYHLRHVLDEVLPLLGSEGSKKPMSWITNKKDELIYVPSDRVKKEKNGVFWTGGNRY
jgi:hypothetical protein